MAMIKYLENGGTKGIITSPDNLVSAIKNTSGTIFTKE